MADISSSERELREILAGMERLAETFQTILGELRIETERIRSELMRSEIGIDVEGEASRCGQPGYDFRNMFLYELEVNRSAMGRLIDSLHKVPSSPNFNRRANPVERVGDLVQYRLSDCMHVKGFGKKSAAELVMALRQYGLSLQPETSVYGHHLVQEIEQEIRWQKECVKACKTELSDAGFSVRWANRLNERGYRTVEDLMKDPTKFLAYFREKEPKRIDEMLKYLAEYGFPVFAQKLRKQLS